MPEKSENDPDHLQRLHEQFLAAVANFLQKDSYVLF